MVFARPTRYIRRGGARARVLARSRFRSAVRAVIRRQVRPIRRMRAYRRNIFNAVMRRQLG